MPLQRSFEDLGTPLSEVTFCVLDLETTGGSPADCAITEVGACKLVRGEVVGTFQTLVNPGCPVPAFVRLLTGISDDELVEAPDLESVIPSLLEFLRDSVIVAHNARFDTGFINAALARLDYPPLTNRVVDTAILARKILAGEVPNHKLSTLAGYLRCAHRPTHRAYADVLATVDVLHHLIERVAGFGVTTLEDLVAMSSTRIDGTFSKLRLADDLPHAGGVYRFIGVNGNTLYVGKATDLRARVRSYFYGDPRRKIRDLLREVDRIEIQVHETMLEAEVAEARAIMREKPPYNRAGKRTASWYLKVHTAAKTPKVTSARVPKEDGNLYLGPFPNLSVVRTLIDALQDSFSIHRCSEPARCRGCAFSQIGRCSGTDAPMHAAEVRRLADALGHEPEGIFEPLERKMHRLAALQRFEEATETRERAALVERTLLRHLQVRSLLDAGDVVVAIEGRALLIRNGQLACGTHLCGDLDATLARLEAGADCAPVGTFITAQVQNEARVISAWLRRNAALCKVLHASGAWATPVAAGRLGSRFAVRATT